MFSSGFLRGIDPHSGSVYPQSGCLCYEGVEGETPDNHGTLKVVFQYSSSYHRGIDPNSNSGYVSCFIGGTPDKHGVPKVVFQ